MSERPDTEARDRAEALDKEVRTLRKKLERSERARIRLEGLRDRTQRLHQALQDELEAARVETEAALSELRTAQAQLVQSEKMASLGALTSGIAHEIKNPLNFVTNFASLSRELLDDLAREADPDERAALLADLRTNAEKIEAHGQRADAIVRSMMAHARSGTGERDVVDVNGLVEEYATHALHATRVRHPDFAPVLALDLAADAGQAWVGSQEIGRVVVNLVDNALDAVLRRAKAEADGYTPTVSVATRQAGGAVEVRVEDNGVGMAEAVRLRSFEPFFTTKPTGQGTGLGLSLSYDIVVQGHGGQMSVESVEGQGTTFTVRLPAA